MSVSWGRVSKQLASVDASKPIEEATVAVLKVLNEQMDQRLLSDDEVRVVLDYVSKLQAGHALLKEKPDEKWAAMLPGEYQIRDTVRVRYDAYTGTHGEKHNGRRGRVARVHQGKVVVVYDDASADESYYHTPSHLERLL